MCIWGDNNDDDDDDDDVLSVCSLVHTIWCDNVGFNDKLLFPCLSRASRRLRMLSSGTTVT